MSVSEPFWDPTVAGWKSCTIFQHSIRSGKPLTPTCSHGQKLAPPGKQHLPMLKGGAVSVRSVAYIGGPKNIVHVPYNRDDRASGYIGGSPGLGDARFLTWLKHYARNRKPAVPTWGLILLLHSSGAFLLAVESRWSCRCIIQGLGFRV